MVFAWLTFSRPLAFAPALHLRIGMRFWWPDWQPRERSPSSDSECSTAGHSSLASDASFYSADAAAETEMTDGQTGRADTSGVGLPLVDSPASPAVPRLGTGDAWDSAASSTALTVASPTTHPVAPPILGLSIEGLQPPEAALTSASLRLEGNPGPLYLV